MVAFSQTPWTRYRIRSISLPTRSHPTTIRIEQELTKLTSFDSSSSSSETISSSLSNLLELYKSINEVLNLPLTQQTLASHRHENWVQELVDSSIRYLDICDNTRNAVLTVKESLRELQSGIRRSKYEDSGVENSIVAYISSRKRIKYDCLKKSLREMDITIGAFPQLELENPLTAAVIRVLREASSVTSTVFKSLISFLAVPAPWRPKPSRWSLVSRLVHKGAISRNNQSERLNELENLDFAINDLQFRSLSKDGEAMVEIEKIQFAVRERLMGLDKSIERIELGIESLFRELIHNRVSLLNILSR